MAYAAALADEKATNAGEAFPSENPHMLTLNII